MVGQAKFDALVRARRKELRKKSCKNCMQSQDSSYQPSAVNLSHESTKSAEVNPFGVYFPPMSIGMRATTRYDFVRKVKTLKAEIVKIQSEMQPIIDRLPAEETSGIGVFLRDGNRVIDSLNQMMDEQKYKYQLENLQLMDLQRLYYHAVNLQQGHLHPQNHPINASAVTSKTDLIEFITKDYGHHPYSVFQQHAYFNAPIQPPPVVTPPVLGTPVQKSSTTPPQTSTNNPNDPMNAYLTSFP